MPDPPAGAPVLSEDPDPEMHAVPEPPSPVVSPRFRLHQADRFPRVRAEAWSLGGSVRRNTRHRSAMTIVRHLRGHGATLYPAETFDIADMLGERPSRQVAVFPDRRRGSEAGPAQPVSQRWR